MQSTNQKIKNAILNSFLDKNTFEQNDEYAAKLIANTKDETMYNRILDEVQYCKSFTFAVAFIESGILNSLKTVLKDLNVQGRILTSTYLYFNKPQMFRELLKLPNVEIRVYEQNHGKFHAKGYLFQHEGYHSALVGSSNFTAGALKVNKEWNLLFTSHNNGKLTEDIASEIEEQWKGASKLTPEWIDEYEKKYKIQNKPAIKVVSQSVDEDNSNYSIIKPNKMQKEALKNLQKLRLLRETKGLIISATGTGKTYLAALDVKNYNPKRFLFVAHREQILKKSLDSFHKVLGGDKKTNYGILSGNTKNTDAKYLFATVQTLSKAENLNQFKRDEFDYILIDEAHHVGSKIYGKLLDYFTPDFLLGMTATPERSDDKNIYELFDYNVPYEIRLQEALEEEMLVPFHYIGVSDYTYNGEVIDDNTNLKYLVSEERVKYVVEQSKYYGYDGDVLHGLVFVSRKEEADEIAKLLTKNGYPAQMLSGEDSQEQREQAIEKLKNGELTYLVTVDIFNEGIDIPFINQVIMMRKTESVIVFVQQLGRGLRKAQGKEYLTVIDFIGNYKNNYLIPVALTGDQSRTREGIREHVETGQIEGLSTINFELVAKKRILKQLRGKKNLFTLEIKKDYQELKRRLNKTPLIADFIKNNMVASQAILSILNKKGNYNDFLLKVDKDAAYSWENDYLDKTLTFITSEFLSGKRIHELLLLQKLLDNGVSSRSELEKLVVDNGSYCNDDVLNSVERILTLEYYKPKSYDDKNDKEKNKTEFAKLGGQTLIEIGNNKEYRFNKEISELLEKDHGFKKLFVDVIKAGLLNAREYDKENIFTIEKRYTRSDVNRLLNWQRKIPAQSIGGYFIESGYCPIFVTYVKSNDIENSIKYEDRFISNSKIHCYTKNGRKLGKGETLKMFAGVSEGNPKLTYLLFVKRSDAEDDDEFVYLGTGKVTADSLKQEYREIDKKGKLVNTPIVSYDLKLDIPVSLARYRMLTERSNE
ncbi:DEAD/DEAH box helicase [Lactobacillus salivarius]|uniref:DEAD/DEAH box helicase n=2 Tax=Ligilactobacillus salivarius TaxID=1624 RepID=A0ABD6J3E9_9LACO|nr:DEAD/DEAH box helicase [Ligilactobacillus salivarius]MYY20155.1 DEAD/DEAH box helicase [Ligilactobacillus salivarius]MYY72525.1 DEAD/DEAH box helicase [Ligilactobacillus salivarius]